MKEYHWDRDAYAASARQAAAEGIVLLKNDREMLPLRDGERIALFGRAQFRYYKSGTGSGGLVNTDYVVGIRDALLSSGRYRLNGSLSGVYEAWLEDHPFDEGEGWAAEPWFQEEMPLTEELVRRTSYTAPPARTGTTVQPRGVFSSPRPNGTCWRWSAASFPGRQCS